MSGPVLTEADTCRKFVLPILLRGGWEDPPYSIAEQRTFTDGRVLVAGRTVRRGPQKRADYILRYRPDFPIALIEAKAIHKSASDGVQQAREYAEILDLPFAYATNGREIIELDLLNGTEQVVDTIPTPDELFERLRISKGITDDEQSKLLAPLAPGTNKPRYYQHIAITRTVEAILNGRKRLLLTLATGTGKTTVAFHICWKLWQSQWNRLGELRRPRILYLADRKVLVDNPKDKEFASFGDARFRIENREANKSREMYFGLYQSLHGGDSALYKQFDPGFFDLIVIDECHRGSARDDSQWREVLEHFEPAVQLGMTATPLRDENRDTYEYFGEPVYTYSLKQGIEDGFLAPYKVHRVQTDVDSVGWRPSVGEKDRYGRVIPDRIYGTPDFDSQLVHRERTKAIARHLHSFMQHEDPLGKTIVFCVDQEHASSMRRELSNLNSDEMRNSSDFVCRITSDEADIGRRFLESFQDVETRSPVIVTTSKLLTTGVDVPTCRNVVLAKSITSMTEFKQIIGRGTRLRDDYGKYYFNIIDYTGSATTLFADPEFDGDPVSAQEYNLAELLEDQEPAAVEVDQQLDEEPLLVSPRDQLGDDSEGTIRKLYVDGSRVEITAHLVYELDDQGRQLRAVSYSKYSGDTVRTLYANGAELRRLWRNPETRQTLTAELGERGVELQELIERSGSQDVDPFDLLCNVAFNAPLRTRRERADRVRNEEADFWHRYSESAREVLDHLLDRYTEHGITEFTLPDVLKVPPLNNLGNPLEISSRFGGADGLRSATLELQELLYAA